MNKKVRRQLTLFIKRNFAKEIETIRKQFNPIQYQLIDSHVTLCREDEIKNMEAVLYNLQRLDKSAITIHFGEVTRFQNGKGVLIPAFGHNDAFHLLRSKVLEGQAETVQRHEPHITLMHPRNSTCTDEIFSEIQKAILPKQLTFDTISLIEQVDDKPWKILKVYKLTSDKN